ncbi:MAG: DsbC family protein [Pseudomonadota bacterium]|nr:DsbC family protein [Pseudomonadota bacterium]MDP1905473.1 DsbC family protein [Pseudomonadota bacterium]MDP2351082.1 DsbC family protein [Pseudomonadota bacterium]
MRKSMLTLAVVATTAIAATTAILATTAMAGDAEIRQSIESRFPGTKVTEINKSVLPSIFEVVMESQQGPVVAYTDDKGRYVLVGDLLDIKTERNFTRERMDKLNEVKFDSLPLKQAIKIVKGNGKRRLAVFSDLDCPYCKKLEAELEKVDNVTVYTFLYPLPMHPDAPRKSKQIWCSKDRVAAWNDYMQKGKLPTGKGDCDNPIDENLALGAKLRIDGTPAMIFANGKRVPGYMPAARLDEMLNTAEKAR